MASILGFNTLPFAQLVSGFASWDSQLDSHDVILFSKLLITVSLGVANGKGCLPFVAFPWASNKAVALGHWPILYAFAVERPSDTHVR
jgi:hypothetical protein